eukprot:scaffold6931_cov119-Isochrysis_galbana.AAC.1
MSRRAAAISTSTSRVRYMLHVRRFIACCSYASSASACGKPRCHRGQRPQPAPWPRLVGPRSRSACQASGVPLAPRARR